MWDIHAHGKYDTPHMNRFHSRTFRCRMGKLTKPLNIKHVFRVNKHGCRGRSKGEGLWAIFNKEKKKTRKRRLLNSPDFPVCSGLLFFLLYFEFPSLFPSPLSDWRQVTFKTLHAPVNILHAGILVQDGQTCWITPPFEARVDLTSFQTD